MKRLNKKGFTLVELLAVIVILSAIVLITRPVILDIMNDAKNEVALRSAEAYLTIIEDTLTEYVTNNSGIEDGMYYVMSNGNICLGELIENECSSNVVKINVSKDAPSEGIIIYKNHTVKEIMFVYNDQSIIKNSNGKLVFTEIEKPVLGDSLVPVAYNGIDWIVVDEESNWYNYLAQDWANAVILKKGITKNVGDVVTVDGTNPDALAMYVWVPRYEYKIDGNYGTNGISENLPGEIDVNFIPQDKTKATDEYIIHPAFTFGDKEISGIWVGKFELSHTTLSSSTTDNNLNCSNENCSTADKLRVLPNNISLRYNNVSNFFYAIRSMNRSGNAFGLNSSTLDTHMIKNSEWAAVSYLSQSKYGKYGNSYYEENDKEVYLNNSNNFYTGASSGYSTADSANNGTYKYNDGVILEETSVSISQIDDSSEQWIFDNNVYKSTNKTEETSSNLSFSFSLKVPATLSFEWSVSSEQNYDIAYYVVKKDEEEIYMDQISGNWYIGEEANLIYSTISKSLTPGNYEINFEYRKDGSVSKGLDSAFVKNLKVVEFSNKSNKVYTQSGVGASTTGNITGIYDMNGGAWEYAMGVFANASGDIFSGDTSSANSGFSGKLYNTSSSYTGASLPNAKYFDIYKATSNTTISVKTACGGGICYGHALSETESWYSDHNNFVSSQKPWTVRSGGFSDTSIAGIFFYHRNTGKAINSYSTRPVIVSIK